MRVVSVIESLLHGGAETVLVDLVRGLRGHDHEVVHFTRAHGAEAAPWILRALADASAPCHDVHWTALADPAARGALLGPEPNVVVHHWWGQDTLRPWVEGGAFSGSPRRPYFVLVLHRSRVPAPLGYDQYVLVSPSQRPQVAALDPSRVVVIPNGVDLARFPIRAGPLAEGQKGQQAERPFTIGRLSNLRPEKIPADWIATATGYGLDDARFVIAGDGPLRPVLEADARRLGLEGRFHFPGYVARDEVPALLATFDVFCYLTSTAVECHPVALLEACATGVPIVAEDKGGVPDIVRDGVNGLLARSPEEIGGLLRRLRDDDALRSQLAAAGRVVAGQFSLERQTAGFATLLECAARG
jgi:glycosyltransferase involved in cell wall biosynthesis